MTGDGTPGHPDWPHIGVALMQPRRAGASPWCRRIPVCRRASSTATTANPTTSRHCARAANWLANYASAATYVGSPEWATSQHLCASAPMGVDGDPRAVVDQRCRVRGIENLWVIDGSILPAHHQPRAACDHRDARASRRGIRVSGTSVRYRRRSASGAPDVAARRRGPGPTTRSRPLRRRRSRPSRSSKHASPSGRRPC